MWKDFLLLICHQLSPTNVYNVLTWDRAVLVAATVAGLEIDYARVLISVLYERAFNTSSIYVGVPIWNCDTLRHLAETVDICLIRDEDNAAPPRRGPRIEVP